MTQSQKLAIRGSEIRSRLNELNGVAELGDDQKREADALTREYDTVEREMRMALVIEDEPAKVTPTATDGEAKERDALLERASLANYVNAAITGTEVRGAELELSQAFECDGLVPLEMLETRAVTPAPSTVHNQQETIAQDAFLGNVAPYMGIDTPRVGTGEVSYPVITTSVTAAARDKHTSGNNQVSPSTAGAITVTTCTPKRVTGQLEFRVEDSAVLRGLEEALRMNLSSALGNAHDDLLVNGQSAVSNQVAKIGGLFGPDSSGAVITPASAEGTTDTFASYVQKLAGGIDGLYATMPSAVRLLSSPEVIADMLGTFATNTAISAYEHCNRVFGGVQSSDRIGHASNVSAGLLRLSSVSHRAAIAPIWQGMQLIRDPYRGAAKGVVTVTAIMLASPVKILRSSAFKALSFKTS